MQVHCNPSNELYNVKFKLYCLMTKPSNCVSFIISKSQLQRHHNYQMGTFKNLAFPFPCLVTLKEYLTVSVPSLLNHITLG